MATYKVIQDIEAEDKFLGPMTLKQFIFGVGALFFAYLGFFAVTKGAAFLLVVFVPPALLGAFLAIPWSSDQPTEVWVVAKLRFFLKPKTRVWDQAGLEELVTITVPKKIEKHLTNGLDQTEVQSRLKALADTIDTRGWAVKNATLDDTYQPFMPVGDRLINPASLPQEVPTIDSTQTVDVFDEGNEVSENFEHMIQESSQIRKQQSLDKMQRIRNGEPLESIQQPQVHFTAPTETIDEETLSQQLRNTRTAHDSVNSHMRTLSVYPGAGSLAQQPAATAPVQQPVAAAQPVTAPVTPKNEAAILNMSQRNDLYVDTIARNINKRTTGDNEVVVSLR